ncbi:hypothetical protein MGN70_005371 [Eutypa lata]|uniref:Putative nadh-ubiquinone oxidoreductase kDa subunit protein n=1 Tax=Eutypa lata (strain UCR-EL1) TaxID=1287681 RepID=M7T626_EUTLA|nr:putative nadh-ubiquinone oxidoreductase kda subunit protein [Eutypa lata UCREL1]KAI1253163.1 hypothetical protein MGN70_005371 [Eutypa lata]
MQALRQRASCVARRSKLSTPRNSRSYASEGHGEHHHNDHHHAAPPVNEGLGSAFYFFAGALPFSYFAYSISRPGKDGEPSSISTWLNSFDYLSNTFAERNDVRTRAIELAAHDKHLFMNSGKNPHIDLKMPELIGSASPYAVPAGHYPKLDHVTEHYRQKHVEEEERKVKKLLQKQKQEQEQEQEQP